MTQTQPQDQAPPTGSPPPPGPTPTSSGFFDQIRSVGVRRSSDRWVAGVGGGLARRFGVDPLLVRAGIIALLIFGIGFLAYLIAWALLPDEDDSILAERAIRDGDGWGVFLLVVIALSVLGAGPLFADAGGWWSLVTTLALIGGVWWLVSRHRGTSWRSGTTPPPPAPGTATPPAPGGRPQPVWAPATTLPAGYEPPPAATSPRPTAAASTAYRRPKAPSAGLAGFLLALGAAVVGYGLGRLAGPLGGASGDLVAMIGATAAAGLVTLVLGLMGRRSALTSLLSIVLAVSLLGTWGATSAPDGGGQQTWRPTAESTRTTYAWNAGQATLDLRGVTEPPTQREISAEVSLGELVVYVPAGITTRVIATAELGSVTVQGTDAAPGIESEGGPSVTTERVFGEGEPDLTVRATVRLGSLRIVPPSDPA